ncbi:hypothetical protein R69749_04625 [Paraburkholderia domus]|jgi:hypothetical protein|uniref:Uncharacterized protein n=1 Tax=Paraburkholderia domus TaxID=2793075 RepID=A0A9N8MV40_9BURK|nr:hypothetical protein R70006_02988 [Paraburkholderia domus]CAE6827786.1 hypothetical protein R75483_06556 [Paraburkholderia domus]CAE6844782.1 hypothetical protein R69749_04625 [Paraburkholderia domus]CAE6909629.1 hypothetical protein R70211_03823 [Paraburkholderia domus]CAE6912166.1 hypothetical protein R70199_04379 [Paraburkholderia domus]
MNLHGRLRVSNQRHRMQCLHLSQHVELGEPVGAFVDQVCDVAMNEDLAGRCAGNGFRYAAVGAADPQYVGPLVAGETLERAGWLRLSALISYIAP